MRLIDVSAWVGQWPFTMTGPCDLAGLARAASVAGIDTVVVSPLSAVLGPDATGSNVALLDEAAADQVHEMTVGVAPVVNPSMPGWDEDLDGLLDRSGDRIVGIRLVPEYHQVSLESDAVANAIAKAEANDLTVMIQLRMQDERSHHPLMPVPPVPVAEVVALAGRHPEARFVACAAYAPELGALAEAPNVAAECSMVETADTVTDFPNRIGQQRALLGTHQPLFEPAAGVAKSRATDDGIRDAVAGGNALDWFPRLRAITGENAA